MCDVECSSYHGTGLRYYDFDEAFIYDAQLDVGLKFPYILDLGEFCQHYCLSTMQLTP